MLIPASQELITPAALNRLFKRARAGLPEVASVIATSLDGGYGYLSKSFRLLLQWRGGDGPQTLVAKLPLQARIDAMTPDAVRMYRREAMFHRVVAEKVEIPTAHAYVAEIDEESQAAVMVFEDLSALETFSDDESVSVERAQCSLEHLASLHARFWNSAELDDMDWLAHPAKTAVDQVDAERFAISWPRMVSSGAYPLSKTQLRIGELLYTKMDGLYEQLHAGPYSLIHTDIHQENIFFDGLEPVFIDWQLAERANPAKDVAKLTASWLGPGTIQREQPALLRGYHEALARRAITGYSLEALTRHVHLATCHYMAITLFLADRDFAAMATNIEGRTDFTTSRLLAACDREEVLAVVESV
ncbi:MAG: phosphotransferase [Chloroflexi bacterium]|nr:phosphotransferase [Chloroflexota bacterium]